MIGRSYGAPFITREVERQQPMSFLKTHGPPFWGFVLMLSSKSSEVRRLGVSISSPRKLQTTIYLPLQPDVGGCNRCRVKSVDKSKLLFISCFLL